MNLLKLNIRVSWLLTLGLLIISLSIGASQVKAQWICGQDESCSDTSAYTICSDINCSRFCYTTCSDEAGGTSGSCNDWSNNNQAAQDYCDALAGSNLGYDCQGYCTPSGCVSNCPTCQQYTTYNQCTGDGESTTYAEWRILSANFSWGWGPICDTTAVSKQADAACSSPTEGDGGNNPGNPSQPVQPNPSCKPGAGEFFCGVDNECRLRLCGGDSTVVADSRCGNKCKPGLPPTQIGKRDPDRCAPRQIGGEWYIGEACPNCTGPNGNTYQHGGPYRCDASTCCPSGGQGGDSCTYANQCYSGTCAAGACKDKTRDGKALAKRGEYCTQKEDCQSGKCNLTSGKCWRSGNDCDPNFQPQCNSDGECDPGPCGVDDACRGVAGLCADTTWCGEKGCSATISQPNLPQQTCNKLTNTGYNDVCNSSDPARIADKSGYAYPGKTYMSAINMGPSNSALPHAHKFTLYNATTGTVRSTGWIFSTQQGQVYSFNAADLVAYYGEKLTDNTVYYWNTQSYSWISKLSSSQTGWWSFIYNPDSTPPTVYLNNTGVPACLTKNTLPNFSATAIDSTSGVSNVTFRLTNISAVQPSGKEYQDATSVYEYSTLIDHINTLGPSPATKFKLEVKAVDKANNATTYTTGDSLNKNNCPNKSSSQCIVFLFQTTSCQPFTESGKVFTNQ